MLLKVLLFMNTACFVLELIIIAHTRPRDQLVLIIELAQNENNFEGFCTGKCHQTQIFYF